MHIKSIFSSKELEENLTIKDFLIVQKEGRRSIKREVTHYNLDMVISVGYRVQSKRATQFRIWATKILRNYIVNATEKRLTVVEHRINLIEAETKAAFKYLFNDENTTLL